MDWVTLISLYPVAESLAKKSAHIKEWIERRAKKDDPVVLLYLEVLQSRVEAKEDNLRNSILTAMLANPQLDEEHIKGRLIKALEVAKKVADLARV